MSQTAKSTAAAAARAAGAGDIFEPSDEWRALARQILHKNDLPAPAIADLRKLTRMVADPRKAADVFEELHSALKPTPRFRTLQRALLCVKHLVARAPRGCLSPMNRGGAAAGAWTFRGGESLRRGHSVGASRGGAAAETSTFRGGESLRRGRSAGASR